MKVLKILFFVRGAAPTAEQHAEAAALNGNVCFRNALAISSHAALEDCDGVAGETPSFYSAKFPDAVDAIEARNKKIAALSAKVGDAPAPTKGKEPAPTAAAMTAPAAPAPTPAPAPPAAPAAPAAKAAESKAPGWKPNA
jgi:hypothetical protein